MEISLATSGNTFEIPGDTVIVQLVLLLDTHKVMVSKSFIIVPDISEDFIFGLPTLSELGLLTYMQTHINTSTVSVEEQYIELTSNDAHIFPTHSGPRGLFLTRNQI